MQDDGDDHQTGHDTGMPADGGDHASGADGRMPAPDTPGPRNHDGIVRLADCGSRSGERILSELRATWDSLRGGRAVPERSRIEPRALRSALSHAFILERIAPGAARFRLAGRHLIDLMGMEVRGMPLCALFNPPSRGHLSDVLETVFAGPQIVELIMQSEAGYARPALSARMLLLPLRSDLGDVTRALGALVSNGGIGAPPRRFDLIGEELTPVIAGARTLQPSPSRPGFADAPEPWYPLPRPNASAPAAEPGTPAPDESLPFHDDAEGRMPDDTTGNHDRPDDHPVSGPDSGPAHSPDARRRGFRVIPGGR